MKKNINEASVNMSITDLTSSDLETLSRMLALAGQAETSSEVGNAPIGAFDPTNAINDALKLEPAPIGDMNSTDSVSDIDPVQGKLGDNMDGIDNMSDMNMDGMDDIFENLNRMSILSGIKLSESEMCESDSEESDEDDQIDESVISEEEHAQLMGRIGSALAGAKTGANVGKIVGPEGAAIGAAVGGYAGWKASAPDENNTQQGVQEEAPYSNNEFDDHSDSDEFGELEFNLGPVDAFNEVPDQFENGPELQGFNSSSDFRSTINSLNDIEHAPENQPTGSIEVVVDGPDLQSDDIQEIRHMHESAMFNFALDEDTVNELGSPGLGDNRVFGPYKNKVEAINDARKEFPGGEEGVDFDFQVKPEGIYWVKLNKLNEDINTQREEKDVDPESFKGDKNANQEKEIQKDGDNGLVESWNYRDIVNKLLDLDKE